MNCASLVWHTILSLWLIYSVCWEKEIQIPGTVTSVEVNVFSCVVKEMQWNTAISSRSCQWQHLGDVVWEKSLVPDYCLCTEVTLWPAKLMSPGFFKSCGLWIDFSVWEDLENWCCPRAEMKSSPHLLWAFSALHLGLCPTSQVSGGSFMAASVCRVVNSHPQTQRGLDFVLILIYSAWPQSLCIFLCSVTHIDAAWRPVSHWQSQAALI